MRRSIPVISAIALLIGACGGRSDEPSTGQPRIVVTHAVLGSVVTELVGDAADVVVLIPNGADPHEWEPSAKDIERIGRADFVVANGLGLEANLEEALDEAENGGVPVFRATDHIDVLAGGSRDDDPEDIDDHDRAEGDPHFWTDPIAMSNVVVALDDRLDDVGIAVDGDALVSVLAGLDEELRSMLEPITDRLLVTGHESLGYFARRYDFTLVGAVIPSLSTEADATAATMADLKKSIEDSGVSTVFTELGTPADVAAAIAAETGADLVEIPTHLVPDDGRYGSFIRVLASTIAAALAP